MRDHRLHLDFGMSKFMRKLSRFWESYGWAFALVLTLVFLGLDALWSLRSFFMSFVFVSVPAVLTVAVWLVALLPVFEEHTVEISIGGALGAGLYSLGAGLGLAYLFVDLAWAKYIDSSGLRDQKHDFARAGNLKAEAAKVKPGKVVVLELEDNKTEVSALHLDLPSALFPRSACDVQIAVLIRWTKREAGRYTNGAVGCSFTAEVMCVDWRSQTIFHSGQVHGEPPPKQTSLARDKVVNDDRPYDRLRAFVTQLPQHDTDAMPSLR